MGANFADYLREAYRVLKLDGSLHIWEATSRFEMVFLRKEKSIDVHSKEDDN